jgi:hypothetical protein
MLLSLARKQSLTLEDEDLFLAIQKCESCMPAVNVMGLSGLGESSEAIAKVLKELINSKDQTLSRAKILQKLYMKGVDSLVLDRVTESLINSQAIVRPFRVGKDIMYKMDEEAYRKYINFREESA